jgi:hypothetical protein
MRIITYQLTSISQLFLLYHAACLCLIDILSAPLVIIPGQPPVPQ